MKDITLDEVTFSEFLTLQRTQDPLKDLEEVSEDVRKIIKNVFNIRDTFFSNF